MNLLHKCKLIVMALLVSLVAMIVPATAMAAGAGPDFSGILDGLDTGTIVTAILAAAALIAIVGFAKWGAKKLARFFG
jgi:hypothetical protein